MGRPEIVNIIKNADADGKIVIVDLEGIESQLVSRAIRHAVVLTKTSAAVKSRVQKDLENQLRGAGIDMIEPSLVARAAFSELFAYGGDLTSMLNNSEIVTGGKVDKALVNATAFTEAEYERLK